MVDAKYDVCVIGGGPAGYAAAMRAWDFGKRVCLIERGSLGGAGVHNGALSSKTLWELSRDYVNATRIDRGFLAREVEVDFVQVKRRVEVAVDRKVHQLQTQLDALKRKGYGFEGTIDFLAGRARFIDAQTLRLDSPGASTSKEIAAENFVVAVGCRPRTLVELPIDGRCVITSDHVMDLDCFPRSLVILGAGVVGCEFATIFANYGQTKVNLIDRADRILPFEDEDISRVCSRNLEKKGVTIHRGAKLLNMERVGNEVCYTIEHRGGGQETIRVEKALVAVGRVPNTEELGLEALGVKLGARGYIEVEDTRTAVPNIWAVGDVTDDLALFSVAEIEGRHAVERMYGEVPGALSYDNLSTIMFLDPELAAIGINEQQARERKLPYRVAVYGYDLVNRAIAMHRTEGFVKLLVSDDEDMRILGLRALGVHASTTMETVSLMISQHRPIRDLAELFHPHPAIPEGLQDCVRMLLGTSLYKPHVFSSSLRLSRVTYGD